MAPPPLPLPPPWRRDLDYGWVEFKSGKDDIRGYFAAKKGAKNLPAIVMVHENIGVIEHRQDVTRRLADEGYAALTVDLFSRVGGRPPQDFKDPDDRRAKAFIAARDEQALPDLDAGIRWLEQRADVDAGRIGSIGYCMGGGTMLAWICGQTTRIKAAVGFYPTAIVDAPWRPDGKELSRIAVAPKLSCPLQVHFGTADQAVPPAQQERLKEAFKQAAFPVEWHTYDGANHAYHDDTHPNYHREASLASWPRAIEFLRRHLGGGSRQRVAAE
jgi:carboxymethylenebutenolidase